MKKIPVVRLLCLVLLFALMLLARCGTTSQPTSPSAPLSATNLNLIFVVSEDLDFHAFGDMNSATANLTNLGLQRTLLMGTFLQQQVLGGNNVTSIYALEPMTHLQTANNYPDMVSLETIEQFAMLNQIAISSQTTPPTPASSFPVFSAYSTGSLPQGVAPVVFACTACQGLDFNDVNGDNETLVSGIIQADVPGFYVFSAPWETVRTLMTNMNRLESYNLRLPARYSGPNIVYAISIAPSGSASLVVYNSNLNPPPTYPVLPPPQIVNSACATPVFPTIQATGGVGGAVIPGDINTNETVYFIRHAEAHPNANWEDGNYIGAGQWRALDLPNALLGKIHPTQVYSLDPSTPIPAGDGIVDSSYIRPSLTVEPYVIANNMPLNIAASVAVFAQNAPVLSTHASDFFFTKGTFSNETLLVAWEHQHIPPTVNALLSTYQVAQTAPDWPPDDYDTIWTVTLDAQGNLTVDNAMCEGIDSGALPKAPPLF